MSSRSCTHHKLASLLVMFSRCTRQAGALVLPCVVLACISKTLALEEAVLMHLPSMGVRRTALLTFWDSGKRVDRILMMAWPEEDFAARCATTKHTVSASLCKRKHSSALHTPQAQCCGLPTVQSARCHVTQQLAISPELTLQIWQ